MTDLAALAIAVDSRDVATGVNKLDELTAAGGRAETAVEGVGGASQKAGRDTATLAQQVERLLAQIDPLYAAEKRHADTLIMADKALRANILTQQQYNQIIGQSKVQMTEQVRGLLQVKEASGAAKAGMQQLTFQLNDVVTQLASGANPFMVFAQQASQLGQALQMMSAGATGQARNAVGELNSTVSEARETFAETKENLDALTGALGINSQASATGTATTAANAAAHVEQAATTGAATGATTANTGATTANAAATTLATRAKMAFAAALAGPWSAAIIGGVTILGVLGTKLMETEDAMNDVKFASDAVGDAQGILGGIMDLATGKISTQRTALIALARAQLAVAKIQAQARQAEARTGVSAVQQSQLTLEGGLGGGLYFKDNNPAAAKAVAGEVLAGKLSSDEAVKRLTILQRAGALTEEQFIKAASAVANFAVEGENLKVFDSAQRIIDGVGTAMDRNLILKPERAKKALKGVKDAADEAAKAVQAMLEARAEAQGNVWQLADDIAKRQQDWGKELADAMAEVEKMQKDNSRIGMSAYDRAVAELDDKIAAQRKALEQAGEDAITIQAVLDKMRAAGMSGIIQNKNIEDNKNALEEYMRTLDAVSERVDAAAQSMRDAFGSVGGAIGDVITVLDEYGKRQAEIDKQRELGGLDEKQRAELREREASNQISGMVALTGAAKGMFKEHSKGYQAMAAAEKALAVVQLARTAAKVAEGAASMFASLGPFAFPAVAAMLGVMASLGFSGGGKSGPSFDVKEYQDAMGTGSVLGDSSAKSDSIASSLDLLTANSDKDLEYSNAMVRSLRAIETNIGSLSSLLAKQLGIAGGAFETSGLGLGSNTGIDGSLGFGFILKGALDIASKIPVIGGLLGGIGKALFGTKTTKTLLDQGIMFDPATVADILAGGIDGQSYQDIQTKKKKKIFGITTSNKTRVDTVTGALDDGTEQQVALLIGSMRSGIMAAAGVLGIEGAQAAIDAFTVDLGKISLKDLKGSEIQEQLSAIFSKLGDDMAAAAIPALDAFQKVGEGQFETLMRLAKDYQTIDVQMQSIGRTFGAVGASSVEAREALIDLFGSLDDFVDQTQFYRDNFLTGAEQIAPVMTAVAAELERLGLSGVDSIASFKNVVDGLDLTTEAGQSLYAALMALAPGFNAVEKYQAELADKRQSMEITLLDLMGRKTEALALRRRAELAAMDESLRPLQRAIYAYQDLADAQAAAAQKVSDARDALSAAYSRESSSLQSTADKFRDFAKSIGEFRASLFTDVPGVDSYALARSRFDKTANLARLGNEASLSAFTGDAQSYLDAARDRAGSALDYARDVARVARAADQAQAGANGVASMAERQLNQLTASVKGLIDLNDNVTTVWQAIADLEKAQAEEAEVQAEMDKLTNPVPQLQEVNVNLTDINGIIERLNDTQSGTKEEIAALRAELQSALIAIASNTGESARILRRADRGDALATQVEAA